MNKEATKKELVKRVAEIASISETFATGLVNKNIDDGNIMGYAGLFILDRDARDVISYCADEIGNKKNLTKELSSLKKQEQSKAKDIRLPSSPTQKVITQILADLLEPDIKLIRKALFGTENTPFNSLLSASEWVYASRPWFFYERVRKLDETKANDWLADQMENTGSIVVNSSLLKPISTTKEFNILISEAIYDFSLKYLVKTSPNKSKKAVIKFPSTEWEKRWKELDFGNNNDWLWKRLIEWADMLGGSVCWDKVQMISYILTEKLPEIKPFNILVHHGINLPRKTKAKPPKTATDRIKEALIQNRRRYKWITITIRNKDVSPDLIYKEIRETLGLAKKRPLGQNKEKNLQIYLHVRERRPNSPNKKNEKWEEVRRDWNKLYGAKYGQYTDYTALLNAFKRIERDLIINI